MTRQDFGYMERRMHDDGKLNEASERARRFQDPVLARAIEREAQRRTDALAELRRLLRERWSA